MVVTQHAIGLKDVHDSKESECDTDFDDVIAMHDVETFRDLSVLDHCSTSILWDEGPGLIALETSENSYNAGRKYCFQQLGPLQLGGAQRKPQGASAILRSDSTSAVKSDVLRRTRSRAGLNIVPDELSWTATSKELPLKEVFGRKQGETVTVQVYSRQGSTARMRTGSFGKSKSFASKLHFDKSQIDDNDLMKDLQDKMVHTWATETIKLVLTLVDVAKKEQILINNSTFVRSRITARALFQSDPFQIFVAFLITSNFFVNAYESGDVHAKACSHNR
jgi:hypothetical protein